jgi:hypothetical protein
MICWGIFKINTKVKYDMSSDYDLAKEDINEGIRFCRENVLLLLDDSEAILSKGNRYLSLGLYSFAEEELGKLLLLQKELVKAPNTNNRITIDPEIFGKGGSKSHDKKFNEFFNKSTIPNECKALNSVIGGVPLTQNIMINGILMPVNVGVIPVYQKELMNFEARKRIFYILKLYDN